MLSTINKHKNSIKMKSKKNKELRPYIYIRFSQTERDRLKDCAKKDGSNMTIWARQALIKALDARELK